MTTFVQWISYFSLHFTDCTQDLLKRVKRGNIGALTRMKAVEISLDFVLATTHLFWDPLQEDVKLLQTRRLFHHLSDFYNQHNDNLPLILAGDFNSLPNSQVYDWILNQGNLFSAYSKYREEGEPAFTNVNGVKKEVDGKETASFIGTLDYIFHNHK
jgi:mRNA deadenylase 3'-5' endonuclease subunit Ccr4